MRIMGQFSTAIHGLGRSRSLDASILKQVVKCNGPVLDKYKYCLFVGAVLGTLSREEHSKRGLSPAIRGRGKYNQKFKIKELDSFSRGGCHPWQPRVIGRGNQITKFSRFGRAQGSLLPNRLTGLTPLKGMALWVRFVGFVKTKRYLKSAKKHCNK